jgi:hypothetical protein
MIDVLIKTQSVNILRSIFNALSFSTEPNPSESIINNSLPLSNVIGLPQTHRPLVHAFTVDPVLNPDILFMIRLARKDFPLLYGPVTDKIESFIENYKIN